MIADAPEKPSSPAKPLPPAAPRRARKLESRVLTPSQRELLEALRRCVARDGQSPTVRELMAEWGRKSSNGIYNGLRILARKKYLQLIETRPRATARNIILLPLDGKPPRT